MSSMSRTSNFSPQKSTLKSSVSKSTMSTMTTETTETTFDKGGQTRRISMQLFTIQECFQITVSHKWKTLLFFPP